ncbi:PAS domain-containing protein [Rhodovibrionaceae bacterium A322]
MLGREFPEGADKLKSGNIIRDTAFLKVCDDRIRELYDLWKSKSQPGGLPRRADFQPEEMTSLLPFIFMVDKEPVNGDYRYRLVGTNEVQLRRFDPTGKLVKDHCASIDPQLALDNYDYVFGQKGLIYDSTEIDRSPYPPIQDQTLLLPTSSDGKTVDIVIGIGVQFD